MLQADNCHFILIEGLIKANLEITTPIGVIPTEDNVAGTFTYLLLVGSPTVLIVDVHDQVAGTIVDRVILDAAVDDQASVGAGLIATALDHIESKVVTQCDVTMDPCFATRTTLHTGRESLGLHRIVGDVDVLENFHAGADNPGFLIELKLGEALMGGGI